MTKLTSFVFLQKGFYLDLLGDSIYISIRT